MAESNVAWADLCDAINMAIARHPDNLSQMYGWLSERGCLYFSHLPARHYVEAIQFLSGLDKTRRGR